MVGSRRAGTWAAPVPPRRPWHGDWVSPEILLCRRLPPLRWLPGGRENPRRPNFLSPSSAQTLFVPGPSSAESPLSEDAPARSGRPGGAILPASGLGCSGLESEALSWEPSFESLPSSVTLAMASTSAQPCFLNLCDPLSLRAGFHRKKRHQWRLEEGASLGGPSESTSGCHGRARSGGSRGQVRRKHVEHLHFSWTQQPRVVRNNKFLKQVYLPVEEE